MRVPFTKMQGAGNDFVVLDETRGRWHLTAQQYRFLADRHFGVGADQILSVRASTTPEADFEYVIHNADGGEVEQCGNGARCFVRYVKERGLTQKADVRVKVQGGIITLRDQPDGRVTVDMGQPIFDSPQIPFDPMHARPGVSPVADFLLWRLSLYGQESAEVAVLSMGNPHAVTWVQDIELAPVERLGPQIERHPAFPRRVNAGFMQIVHRGLIHLRVFERGAGETLACGTGACAAVVAGIRLGWLDARVDVQARGGRLTIEWPGLGHSVRMTGPAQTVFHGEIEIPE
ncbi:MAG: diaminopimelate epimerase [Alphaproteobacteria bacterium]|nr:diaminopimelate epimerase [Alphaproteobacteria bacterium]MDI9329915.1 diaminopimelate epimerase [Alphaproteobacteria bacterium]